ncbi:hypothetical protein D3C84_535140 [compost metagenome]
MWFLRFSGAALGVALVTGCSTMPEYVESDFARSPIEGSALIGLKTSSVKTGRDFEIYGVCTDNQHEFVIRQTTTALFGSDGKWISYLDGERFYASGKSYENRDEFLRALSSLEVVSAAEGFSGERRMRVASSGAFKIPELCEAKQAHNDAETKRKAEAVAKKNSSLILDVVNRTGVQPMLGGENFKGFNDLVQMFRESGPARYQGKFVWVSDGDYQVSQVLEGGVVLNSALNPATFPPITILTDKPALEGQLWSAISRGPLQFVGLRSYQTILGASRQTLVFKVI